MRLVVRRAEEAVALALSDTRVVVVVGARQAGKSTLARQVMARLPGSRERRLDKPTELSAARADPVAFVRHHGLLVIDEVQRASDLLLAIKATVDSDPRPGRFLLTGSARLLGLRSLPDALVGRAETVELWPFSQGEVEELLPDRDHFRACSPGQAAPDSFVERILARDDIIPAIDESIDFTPRRGSEPIASSIVERVTRGGFPEAVLRDAGRRRRFFTSYIGDLVDRDVTQLADISRRDELHRLLRELAARTAQPLPVSRLATTLGMPATTVERYVSLFEEVFLVKRLPAFRPGGPGRATRQRKLLFVDSGIASHLRGHGGGRLERDRALFGPLLENFVLGELARQISWSGELFTLSHYRTRDGVEVDGVVEHGDGRVHGFEVKAAETVRSEDFAGLRHLQGKLGERFRLGVVFHLGDTLASFGPGLWALPVDALWRAPDPSAD